MSTHPHWDDLGIDSNGPVLFEHELELHHQHGIGLYDLHLTQIEGWQECFVLLTNQRILAINQRKNHVKALFLGRITHLSFSSPFFLQKHWSSPKLRLHVREIQTMWCPGDSSAEWCLVADTHPRRSDRAGYYLLSFRDGGAEAFRIKLSNALASLHRGMNFNSCDTIETSLPQSGRQVTLIKSVEDTHKRVGIGHVLAEQRIRQRSNRQTVQSAFSDLKTLEHCIEDVFKIVEQVEHNNIAGDQQDVNEVRELRNIVTSLGLQRKQHQLSSNSSGSDSVHSGCTDRLLFLRTLSLDLREWLDRALPQLGGVLSLHDVYALYNRSRCAEQSGLISPEDLYKATTLFHDAFHLPFFLKETSKGVKLLCHVTFKENFLHALGQLLTHRYTSSIDAVMLSRYLHISLWTATELLYDAEEEEILCRAETACGVEFYWNVFSHGASEDE